MTPPHTQQISNHTNHIQHPCHHDDDHCPENDGRTTHHDWNENIAPHCVSAHSPLKPVLIVAQVGGQEQGDQQQVWFLHQCHNMRHQGNNDSIIAHAEPLWYQHHCNHFSSWSATPMKHRKQILRAEREADEEEDESLPPS